MANHNSANDDLDTTNTVGDTEPATKHDVGIGGGLGAVGGAIIGALAGGPVGAVIGAIAGGAASAGAVDVVDKHDHDYARTESHDTTPDMNATTSSAIGADTYDAMPGAATGYTGAGDYQRSQAATPVDTGYAAAATPVDTGYAAAATPVDTGYAAAATPVDTGYAASAPAASAVGTDTGRTVELHEEVLSARKDQVQTGEVTMRKEVVTETKSIDVPVTREEVVIERHAVSGAAAGSFDTQTDEVIRVPVMEEQVTVQKTPVVTEEISLGKRQVTETEHITDTVRREEAYIENPDNVDVLERGVGKRN